MNDALGRLERVDLRKIWPDEAQDFTPWLAKKENLALLDETLGLELELEETEQSVGAFSADIVCRDAASESLVLIENQIEPTNHTHLGQTLTYAAGLDAVTIIWIASKFRDEHRAMLDWLNEKTEAQLSFFALEIELWRIGNSAPAPKFNIVARPNDWTAPHVSICTAGLIPSQITIRTILGGVKRPDAEQQPTTEAAVTTTAKLDGFRHRPDGFRIKSVQKPPERATASRPVHERAKLPCPFQVVRGTTCNARIGNRKLYRLD